MSEALRDQNRVTSLITVSSVDGSTVKPSTYTPITGVNPVNVAIVDGSGTQVTSFGGGTQYTEAAVPPAHPVAPTLLWSDGSNWQVVSTAKPLPVGVVTMPTTTVQATNLDIRDLTSTDVVTVTGGAGQTADVKVTLDSESVAVTGTFWQATQPVSGTVTANTGLTQPLTDTELRATPVPVSGSVTADLGANNDVTVTSGTITANLGATDNAVLDQIELNQDSQTTLLTSIDADTSALAGTVDSGKIQVDVITMPAGGSGLTDTELRATPVVVDLGANNDVTVTGSVTADLGANNDVTVTGTVDLGATDNAVLDTIAAKDFATQTTLAAINTKLVTGTDIGDVTINNSTGASAVNIQDGGNTITVDGTVAVTQSGTWDEVGINDSGNSITVDNGGTFAVQATLAAETTKVIGTVNVAASQTIAVTQGTAASLNCTEASASAIKTAVEALDNSVDGNYLNTNLNYAGTDAATGNGTAAGSLRVSLASDSTGIVALTTSSAAIGKLAANSGVDIGDVDILSIATGTNSIGRVGHNITGINHGVKTVTTAGTDVALASTTACKRVTIQSQTDNTSLIAVGGSGVDATIATGTGVVLYPGDSIELDIDDLADVYIDSLVNGEGVRFTYFT